jgi:NAD(P) transhydrogenase subunit alpha
VPQRLHTPLTSGSNAISGITAVGAIVVAGAMASSFGSLLGFIALVFAMINVAGGFVVTHRMLEMFNPKKK